MPHRGPKPATMAERGLDSAQKRAGEIAIILGGHECWGNGLADPPVTQLRSLIRQVKALRWELWEAGLYAAQAEGVEWSEE